MTTPSTKSASFKMLAPAQSSTAIAEKRWYKVVDCETYGLNALQCVNCGRKYATADISPEEMNARTCPSDDCSEGEQIAESMLDAMTANGGDLPVPEIDDWTLRALKTYRHLRSATCGLYGEDGLDQLWMDIHSLTERLEQICARRGIDIKSEWRRKP